MELTGDNVTFYFKDDEIRKIASMGAARSEYYPSPDYTTGAGKNFISGDTIFAFIDNRKLTKAEIKGGAEGVYITEKEITDTAATDSMSMAGEFSQQHVHKCDQCGSWIIENS